MDIKKVIILVILFLILVIIFKLFTIEKFQNIFTFPDPDGTATYNKECWDIVDETTCNIRPDCIYQTYQTFDSEGKSITEGSCSDFYCSIVTDKDQCNDNDFCEYDEEYGNCNEIQCNTIITPKTCTDIPFCIYDTTEGRCKNEYDMDGSGFPLTPSTTTLKLSCQVIG